MPNWCANNVAFYGKEEDITMLHKHLQETDGKNWFNFFYPCPQKLLEEEKWYEWCIQNWGTKWNCDASDWQISENGRELSFWFDSAWTPPVNLYQFIEEFTNLTVIAQYHEEVMCFVGQYADGIDECYEYSDVDSLELIPEHLIEDWNLYEIVKGEENDEEE